VTVKQFVKRLQTWRQELIDEVLPHYRLGDEERGRLAFARWEDRFTGFLRENIPPHEIARFQALLYPGAYYALRGEGPLELFVRERGRPSLAFIDDLIEATTKGHLKLLNKKSSTQHPKAVKSGNSSHAPQETKEMSVRLFISHSSEDEEVTQALVSLLESAFHFDEKEIRCTSLAAYKLRPGSHTSTTLKHELRVAELVLCVLTPVSTESEWVRFELGAAWAMEGKWVVPLLVGLDFEDLPGPLRELHVIKGTDSADIHHLLEEIGRTLGWKSRPAAKVDKAVRELIRVAEEYEEDDFPLDEFDVADVYDLNIDDPAVLECIALLMANIGTIELVDGHTGRKSSRSVVKVFAEAFLDPPEECSLSYEAEISDSPFEPEDVESWEGDTPWEIDNATHYRLTAELGYKGGSVERVFEFTVEDEENGSRGKYIADGQVRWSSDE